MSQSFIFDKSIPFEERSERIFKFQYDKNPVYRVFCKTLESRYKLSKGQGLLPLLPVRAFREAEVISFPKSDAALIFRSSGTSGMQRSRHFVRSQDLYRESVVRGFRRFFDPSEYTILCYTPGYEENPDSSLVYMLNVLCNLDDSSQSRFLPLDKPLLEDDIDAVRRSGKRLMLFGAAFGLLDLAEISDIRLPADSVVIETGGMKTYRREMEKDELRIKLSKGFGVAKGQIYSEYGMCELLSQAYAKEDGWFETPHWMRITVLDADDPSTVCNPGKEGKIGIMDLANYWSCSFILTDDKGVMDEHGRFRVLGRWNPSDLRGCNFLIERDL